MKKTWWKESVIYQIYPRSFYDTNGDGIGDLRGIIKKLDYIASLGIDVLWLSPIYKSPDDDNGYDISDYRNIQPHFGTLEVFQELLQKIHKKGIKLVMDLVVNHSSDEHHFFTESKKSKDNPYRDYYIWKDPKDGKEPNNWPSFFGGSAWEYDDKTGQYYLHYFGKKQPDLNWENPTLRQEIYSLMKFWLDMGVDGFRMDVIPLISKPESLDDLNTSDFNEIIKNVYAKGPKVHFYLKEMYQQILSKYDCFSVGEGVGISPKEANDYVGEDREELNMIFHFGLMFMGQGAGGKYDVAPYTLQDFKEVFRVWDKAIGNRGWISLNLDNHDFPRMVSRFGNDKKFRVESSKLLLTLLLSLRGTPSIYQGSEIGMTNVAFDSIQDYDDIETLNAYDEAMEKGENEKDWMKLIHNLSRDNVRTPIQWNDNPNAGFSGVKPWLKVNPNYTEINVEAQENDPNSILSFTKKIIRFRKENPTVIYGTFHILDIEDKNIFVFKREDENYSFLVVLNFSDTIQNISKYKLENAEILFGNYELEKQSRKFLSAWESRIYKV